MGSFSGSSKGALVLDSEAPDCFPQELQRQFHPDRHVASSEEPPVAPVQGQEFGFRICFSLGFRKFRAL